MLNTYVFDIRAGVNRDDIAMLDAQVVSHNTVEANAALIQLLIGKHDQDGVLPLLAPHEDCVATEKTKSVHGLLGQGDDGVVIVGSIRNPVICQLCSCWNVGSRYARTSTG